MRRAERLTAPTSELVRLKNRLPAGRGRVGTVAGVAVLAGLGHRVSHTYPRIRT
jgi:hypothetical protein